MRRLQAKWDGKCSACKGPIRVDDWILYDDSKKAKYHPGCAPEPKGGNAEQRKLAERLGFRDAAELGFEPLTVSREPMSELPAPATDESEWDRRETRNGQSELFTL